MGHGDKFLVPKIIGDGFALFVRIEKVQNRPRLFAIL